MLVTDCANMAFHKRLFLYYIAQPVLLIAACFVFVSCTSERWLVFIGIDQEYSLLAYRILKLVIYIIVFVCVLRRSKQYQLLRTKVTRFDGRVCPCCEYILPNNGSLQTTDLDSCLKPGHKITMNRTYLYLDPEHKATCPECGKIMTNAYLYQIWRRILKY